MEVIVLSVAAVIVTAIICYTVYKVYGEKSCEIHDNISERIQMISMSDLTKRQQSECIKAALEASKPEGLK